MAATECHVDPAKFTDAELCEELRRPHMTTYLRKLQAEACARVLERQEDSLRVQALLRKARALQAAKREGEALMEVMATTIKAKKPNVDVQDKIRITGAKIKRLTDDLIRCVMEL